MNLLDDTSNPEATLNNDFRNFIVRYSKAYNGDYDGAQTSSGKWYCVSSLLYLIILIDYIQESLTIPKGPSFQRLIQLFSDSDDDIRYYRSNCYYYNFQEW